MSSSQGPTRNTFYGVTVALLLLLVATLGAATLELGRLGPVVGFGIAGLKAALIGAYFMHIRYSSPMTRLFALVGLVWFAILIGGTLTDTLTRRPPPSQAREGAGPTDPVPREPRPAGR